MAHLTLSSWLMSGLPSESYCSAELEDKYPYIEKYDNVFLVLLNR